MCIHCGSWAVVLAISSATINAFVVVLFSFAFEGIMSVVPLALWAYFSCSALILCGCQESAPFAVPAAAVPTEHAEGGAEDTFLSEMGSGVTVSLQVYAEAVSS